MPFSTELQQKQKFLITVYLALALQQRNNLEEAPG